MGAAKVVPLAQRLETMGKTKELSGALPVLNAFEVEIQTITRRFNELRKALES